MPLSGLALTAKMTAAARALESERPDRLFFDPLAASLAGRSGFELLESWRLPGAPRQDPTIGPRTRAFDELVLEAVADGVRQVVLLGAGMDTRAFRLPLPSATTVFELDEEAVLADKRVLLERECARPRCGRVEVAADLVDDHWPQALLDAGLRREEPCVFVIEALSWCLPERALRRLLETAAELASPGSRLGIDVLSSDLLADAALLPLISRATQQGVYWQFGSNDPVAFLAAHGWSSTATEAAVLARRYGRCEGNAGSEGPVERLAGDVAQDGEASVAAAPVWVLVARR